MKYASGLLLSLFTAVTINAMEISAQYITTDRVLISNRNYCSIVDPFHNKEIKQLLKPENCTHFYSQAIHPNKKRIALGYDGVVSIYNIETDKVERKRTEENWYAHYCAFNPLDNETIFIFYKRDERSMLVKYNYFADKKEGVEWIYRMGCFSLHPFKNHLLLTQNYDSLQIRDTNDLPSRIAKQETEDSYSFSTYSSDGKLIALNNQLNIVIKTHDLQECKLALSQKTGLEYYKQIKFFPHKSLLVILSVIRFEHSEFCFIHYCDIPTNTRLHTTTLFEYAPIYAFDFSPDKTKLLLTLGDKCIVMPLPIEIFKEEIFRFWILKNYQKDTIAIRDELIKYIMAL